MTEFPRTIDHVNEAWLSNLLGATVTGYDVRFLEGGVISDAFLLNAITYSDGDGPKSLVLKLANAVDDRREFAVMNNSYLKEVRFFQQLADDMPLRTPEIYHIAEDGKDNIEFFAIAMEDLTTHSLVFDQVEDPPNEAFTRKINLESAGMHARYWESDLLQADWLALPDDKYEFALHLACRGCVEHKDDYIVQWEQQFGVNPYDGYEDVGRISEITAGPTASQLVDHLHEILSSRPRTLIHGDLRADNIFRTHPSAGLSVEDSKITYIDWQIIQPGPIGPEFTQAWQHSLPVELRRKDLDFLQEYHTRLVQLQPAAAAYTYETLVEDYKIGFILWWQALMTLAMANLPGFSTPEGQRNRRLWETAMYKMKHAMIEHDILDMVKKYSAEIG